MHVYTTKLTKQGRRWAAWVWMPALNVPGKETAYWSFIGSVPSKKAAATLAADRLANLPCEKEPI